MSSAVGYLIAFVVVTMTKTMLLFSKLSRPLSIGACIDVRSAVRVRASTTSKESVVLVPRRQARRYLGGRLLQMRQGSIDQALRKVVGRRHDGQ